MSVVVRMEMPKSCINCDLRYECNAFYAPGKPKPFMKGCMIVCQLPEGHGRLIDADALADDVRSLWDYKTVDGITATTVLNQTLTDIRNCPTIVPAEGSDEMADHLEETYGSKRDIVRELFAEVGKADILLRAEWFMKLPPAAGILAVEDHRIKPDEMHLFVVLSDSEPRRLVLDADFGWLWYNSEGPEE